MKFMYEPFVLRRLAENRIFWVAPKMPFEEILNCFQGEQPFFLVSQLEDDRIAITPNTFCIPTNLLHAGYWPQELLPSGFEYVTMKNGLYPVIVSAHPIPSFSEWLKGFTRCVDNFATQTIFGFVSNYDFQPLQYEKQYEKKYEKTFEGQTREQVHA